MHKHTAICPYCGTARQLQPLITGDLAQERRLEAHDDGLGETPIEGTCPGSALIESKATHAERTRVLASRSANPWRVSGIRAQA